MINFLKWFLASSVFVFGLVGFGWVWADTAVKEKAFEAAFTQAFFDSVRLIGLYDQLSDRIAERDRPIKMIFVGDIMLGRGVENQIIKNGGDFRFPFLLMKDYLDGADLVFGNLEGPISNRGRNQGSIYSFRFLPEAAEGLKFAGFDILSIANNHIWDWGKDALVDTPEILNNLDIQSVGAGSNYVEANQPAFFNFNNTRIAFLAFTNLYPKSLVAGEDVPGVSDFDLGSMREAIREASKKVDLVVVSWHWGEEYQDKSNSGQQRIAKEAIEAGADLVIGHHPHVFQEVEKYRDGFIAYSLGNFVFDQNFSEETMKGMTLEVVVSGKKIARVGPAYFRINSKFQPYFEE